MADASAPVPRVGRAAIVHRTIPVAIATMPTSTRLSALRPAHEWARAIIQITYGRYTRRFNTPATSCRNAGAPTKVVAASTSLTVATATQTPITTNPLPLGERCRRGPTNAPAAKQSPVARYQPIRRYPSGSSAYPVIENAPNSANQIQVRDRIRAHRPTRPCREVSADLDIAHTAWRPRWVRPTWGPHGKQLGNELFRLGPLQGSKRGVQDR